MKNILQPLEKLYYSPLILYTVFMPNTNAISGHTQACIHVSAHCHAHPNTNAVNETKELNNLCLQNVLSVRVCSFSLHMVCLSPSLILSPHPKTQALPLGYVCVSTH